MSRIDIVRDAFFRALAFGLKGVIIAVLVLLFLVILHGWSQLKKH